MNYDPQQPRRRGSEHAAEPPDLAAAGQGAIDFGGERGGASDCNFRANTSVRNRAPDTYAGPEVGLGAADMLLMPGAAEAGEGRSPRSLSVVGPFRVPTLRARRPQKSPCRRAVQSWRSANFIPFLLRPSVRGRRRTMIRCPSGPQPAPSLGSCGDRTPPHPSLSTPLHLAPPPMPSHPA